MLTKKQHWKSLGYSEETWAEANPGFMAHLESREIKEYSREVAQQARIRALHRMYWGAAWVC